MNKLTNSELYKEIKEIAKDYPFSGNCYMSEAILILIARELKEIKDLLVDIRRK